ncbi:HLH domain containing protein [Oryctes borbonicus]|uniref:HLH domain containing protein n=1 Tax=Oryctes borbonicus TaxID=1629725 RepID=A0A0T6B0Z4_9SCAR|nr:HLH domain containing protein [Oryctes borbonicus]
MNNCLADLSRLIPAEYLKKGRGRVEKTEIIEMAIKHMKHLQHLDHYRLGYQECMSETMRFLVEVEGRFPREPLCVRLLAHLQQHCDSLTKQSSPEEPTKVEPNNNHMEEPMPLIEKHHTEAYKYKTNIKLRFNQDLQHARRNSAASIENHSSSHSSPPSEICTRMSADNDSGQSDVTKGVAGGGGATVNTLRDNQNNFNVPVFVLHSKGTFYVPLSIDYQTLLPFLHDWDLLEVHSVLLHPVTINVSFPTGASRVNNYNYP